MLADHGAELPEAGIDRLPVDLDDDIGDASGFLLLGAELKIGQLRSRPEVRIRPEQAVTHVGEMPRFGVIQKSVIFHFGRVADDGVRR